MSIVTEITRINTNIANSYTAVDNKNGTLPQVQNSANLASAIDSIEVIEQATAEGESISLTNTKAMPYSDYVVKGKSEQEGTPSPSNPSEIHSVADDVNLFDASKIANSSISVTDNGKTIIMPLITSGNGNTNTATKLNVLCPDLQVGDVIYIRFKRNLNNNRNKFIYLYGSNKIMYASENSPSYTITQEDLNSYVFLYGNDYDYGETEQCIITDFKIQKNTVPINYSPYNQGTVTIKQRGKNLYNNNDTIATENATINKTNTGFEYTRTSQTSSDMFVASNTKMLKPNTVYTVYFRRIVNNTMYFYSDNLWGTSLSKEILKSDTNYYIYKITTNSTGKVVMGFYSANQTTGDTGNISDIMILEGVFSTLESIGNYELYQGNDYTIQTEPLRSLPNGVKDTLEAEQHRKIEYLVFDGSDDEGWGSYTLLSNNIVQVGKPLSKTAKSRVGLSNRFSVIADYSSTEHIVIAGGLTAVYIHIDQTRFNTQDLAGFKEWLSNNPVTLQYELETEIIEPLTQNQATTMLDIIKTGSYEGTTNIYTDEDVKPTTKVDYYKKG